MFLPNTVVKKLEKKLSPLTISHLDRSIEILHNALGEFNFDANFLLKLQPIKKTLEEKYKISTRKRIMHYIFNVLEAMEIDGSKSHIDYLDALNKNVRSVREAAVKTEPFLTRDKKLEIVNKLKDHLFEYKDHINTEDFFNAYQKYFIAALYTYYLPLRSQDWRLMKVYKKPFDKKMSDEELVELTKKMKESHIYYEAEKKAIILEHKTEKYHGSKILDIPDELHCIIKEWNDYTTSEWLLPTRYGTEFSQSYLSSLVKKIFGTTVTNLRRSYINTELSQYSSDLKMAAKILGHSVATMLSNYKKYEDRDRPSNINDLLKGPES